MTKETNAYLIIQNECIWQFTSTIPVYNIMSISLEKNESMSEDALNTLQQHEVVEFNAIPTSNITNFFCPKKFA